MRQERRATIVTKSIANKRSSDFDVNLESFSSDFRGLLHFNTLSYYLSQSYHKLFSLFSKIQPKKVAWRSPELRKRTKTIAKTDGARRNLSVYLCKRDVTSGKLAFYQPRCLLKLNFCDRCSREKSCCFASVFVFLHVENESSE